tara:strand:- start:692 stop:4147 length:3456 start_codon:yes stop_codon:yes gene_type:complete
MATNTTASFTNHTGNGSAGPFSISFSYLSEAEVDVTVGGVLKTITTHYTFTSATQITFTSGNEPGNGVAIKFQRDTNISSKKVDFNDASILTESDLDTQNDQLLFAQQEVLQKLDTIEENATADQSNAEIRAAVEAATDSNVFTDADHNKLNAIEDNATADQTAAEIRTLVESATDSNVFTDADHSKLNAIDPSADVTDATTVNAAGAVMNSDLDVKGELLVGDGSGDPTALPVGTNTHVLTADSSEATGVKWAAIPGVSGEANQNAFSTIAVSGQDNVVADSTTDTLNIAAGSNVTITTTAGSDTVTIASTDTNTQLSTEQVQDIVGAMFSGNTETNITATYQDDDGTIDLVSTDTNTQLTTEEVQDIVGAMFSGNTETNITATYQDSDGTIDLVSTDTNTTDLASDSSPQLAANLDVQTNEITTSTSNGNIKLDPNGTGVVEIMGDGTTTGNVGAVQLNCSNNTHGVKIKSPPHSAAASYTLTLPNDDGDANQVLKTDGSGNLDWVDQTAAYTNASVDAHLNQSDPTSGYVLSWNGSDYAWVAQSGGGLSSDSQYNTVGGTNAGDSFDGTNATYNTLIGYNAGTAITTADYCVAVGSNSLAAVTTGRFNTAVGDEAGKLIDTGTNNTCLGRRAGQSMTDQQFNVVIGDGANITGSSTTVIGYSAGGSSASSDRSVIIGMNAGMVATGGDNVFVGYDCGNDNTSGTENVFGGRGAGSKVTSGAKNIILGHNAAATGTNDLTTGNNNILIGHDAAASSATVSNEITLGDTNITKFRVPGLNFIIKDSTATDNYVLTVDANGEAGWEAAAGGGVSSDSYENTVGGTNAGNALTSDSVANTFFGNYSGQQIDTGDRNTALGRYTLYNATDETDCVAVGYNALYTNTASENTAVGSYSAMSISSGVGNTSLGFNALKSATTARFSVALGYNAMTGAATSDRNVAIGYYCGYQNTSGGDNVFVGAWCAASATTAVDNVLVGRGAGYDVTSGASNTCIGHAAGNSGTNDITTGSNNTLIGHDAAASSATVSNEITLGDSNIATLRCNVQTISSLSDRRDKTDINTLDLGLDFVKSLNPVKFKWQTRDGNGKDGSYEAGFIAQDFQQLQKENDADYLKLVMDTNPDRLEASYGKLIPVLVKAIQELTIEVETLKSNG